MDDGTIIVRTLHIGCKGEGLPKSSITWYEVDPMNPGDDESLTRMDRVEIIDDLRDDVMITVPREGRSVLSINLDPRNIACRRYICNATNSAGSAVGGVDICLECTCVGF